MSTLRNPRYPLSHLSLRVPWKDNGWDGRVCDCPSMNEACLSLTNCAAKRDDEKEDALAGKAFWELAEEDLPPCKGERGSFLSPKGYFFHVEHPYASWAPTHQHLQKTLVQVPAWTALGVPYKWMMKKPDGCHEKNEKFQLGFDLALEPQITNKKGELMKADNWVQQKSNQRAMLDGFFGHIENDTSLVFFYAKQVPFVDTNERVLIGVGRVASVQASVDYDGSNRTFACTTWEHPIQHTIRPGGVGGVVLPYHAAMEWAKTNETFDPASIAVRVPDSLREQFSYATELVRNDAALQVLLEVRRSLETCQALGIQALSKELGWVHEAIQEIQKLRGDYPGLSGILTALGNPIGHYLAVSLQASAGEQDVWSYLLELVEGNSEAPSGEPIGGTLRSSLKTGLLNPRKLEAWQLLSRFDLTLEQAKKLLERIEDEGVLGQFLANPYELVEWLRWDEHPVTSAVVDQGIFRGKKLLFPRSLQEWEPLDPRRIRCFIVDVLEQAAAGGDTLLPSKEIAQRINELACEPKCAALTLHLQAAESLFDGLVIGLDLPPNGAYQLGRLAEARKVIVEKLDRRRSAVPHGLTRDWASFLDRIVERRPHIERFERARLEKVQALEVLANSRLSVLIGPAGTGKTTLLSALASIPEIKDEKILYLAPTGKARVRIVEAAKNAGVEVEAKTVAQFLLPLKRYDPDEQRYKLDGGSFQGAGTIVIDECSMLTEEAMASTIDSLKGVKRLILVGDHRQLPPIGAGKPFHDLVRHLRPEGIESKFPRVGPNYVELTQRMRHGEDARPRLDLQLSEWFSDEGTDPANDEIWSRLNESLQDDTLRVITWKGSEDFKDVFHKAISSELWDGEPGDQEAFNASLGAKDGRWFNRLDAASKIEAWQLMGPIHGTYCGVRSLNHLLHETYRKKMVAFTANRREIRLPEPFGSEQIVYGDKVIQTRNESLRESRIYPKQTGYVANGEIGVVIGQANWKKNFSSKPSQLSVEFGTQPDRTISYWPNHFSDEGSAPLELAYAITVHKAQGSEFETVFLVLPTSCRNMSRELLYTALTRQKKKVVLLVQGDAMRLRDLTSAQHSATSSRLTNLFDSPSLELFEAKTSRYLDKNLIHQASDKTMLRSKSELLIYEALLSRRCDVSYEKELILGSERRIPDFTIMDDDTGIVWYWEHCGLLHQEDYRERWERKKALYLAHGILPWTANGVPSGAKGILIETNEGDEHSGQTGFRMDQVNTWVARIRGERI